jgi:hypothetical protein
VLTIDDEATKIAARPTLKELLSTDVARGELNIPERGRMRRRTPRELVDQHRRPAAAGRGGTE